MCTLRVLYNRRISKVTVCVCVCVCVCAAYQVCGDIRVQGVK